MRTFGIWAVAGISLALLGCESVAHAQQERHGGDSCQQSIKSMEVELMTNLSRQWNHLGGAKVYPEINFGVFNWFRERVSYKIVPQTFVGGEETEAASDRGTRMIELSRSKWCKLPNENKQAVLFHELLVIAEIEKTGDYSVSARYLPNISAAQAAERQAFAAEEVRLNQDRFVCEVIAYFERGLQNPLQIDETVSPNRYQSKGATAAAAWSQMAFLFQSKSNVVCKRTERQFDPNYRGQYITVCAELATIANSCIQSR
jgi:hypothetical protein